MSFVLRSLGARSASYRSGLYSLRSFHASKCLFDAAPVPGAAEPSDKVKKLAEEIPLLNLIEVNQLLKLLQVKLGLPDLSMMAPMGGGGGGGAAPAKGAAAAAPEAAKPAVKTEFSVKLVKFDAASKIKVIKEVREITKLDLKAAKDLVESAPKVLVKDLKKADAEEIMKKLVAAGGVVELEV